MTADAPPAVRTVAFGDVDQPVWGIAWVPDPREPGFVCLGDADRAVPLSASLVGEQADEEWRLEPDGVRLTARPAGDAVPATGPDGVSAGFDQLCRVSGTFVLAGVEQKVDCLGRRGARTKGLDLGRFTSVRDMSAWFEPGAGFALVALRPGKARGQESDVITAAVLDPEGSRAVAEPRFSTTYAAHGRPERAGLELWLARDEGDEAQEPQYPRRAAGEAVGPYAAATVGALDVQAALFRWHSRGHDGAGVYLLARRG
ncbi:MAG: hypothetical protein JOZ98_13925 [Solirubrobacterales bacterium]|nr:hypothetical protein [Solirubrobacterales bacterium]